MVLVTGGTGLVGSHLLHRLVRMSEPVRALRRANSDLSLVADIGDQIEWIEADVLDVTALASAFEGVTKVYHVAAMVSYDPEKKDEMMLVNVEGTTNMVNLCLDFDVQKLLHVSSIAALGRKKTEQKIDEKTVWEDSKYNSPYGVSKFRAEREVWRGIAEGLDAVIINPSVIIGAGKWNETSTQLITSIDKGMMFYPPGITGYVDVRDVSEIAIELMESDITNERYIVNAENLTFKEVFTMIAQDLDKKPPIIKAQKWMAGVAYRLLKLRKVFTGKPALITRELVRNLGNKYYYDHSRIRKALGYSFIPIKDAVADATAAYLESKGKGLGYSAPQYNPE